MIERAVMLAIPPVAILAAAAVFLGPGATRPALGARAYGAPGPGAVAALRIVTASSLFGVEEAAAVPDLAVSLGGADAWRGASGDDGVAEAAPKKPAGASGRQKHVIPIRVLAGARVLLSGDIDVGGTHPTTVVDPAWIVGPARGELRVRAAAARGVFAVPFPGVLVVEVRDPAGAPVRGAEISFSAPGVRDGAFPRTDEIGRAEAPITPFAHTIDLEIDARGAGKEGHWEGHLPVVPGAMDLEPAGGATLRVVAPTTRTRAYLSLWGPDGREVGAVVALTPQPDGNQASGPLPPPFVVDGSALAIGVASDPREQGAGAVVWPIGRGRAIAPELELLLDGMPEAINRETARAWRVRQLGLLVLAAAAAAEVFWLLASSRRSQARLEAHLAEASDEPRDAALRAARSPATAWAFASAGLVAFAFSIVATLAAFR